MHSPRLPTNRRSWRVLLDPAEEQFDGQTPLRKEIGDRLGRWQQIVSTRCEALFRLSSLLSNLRATASLHWIFGGFGPWRAGEEAGCGRRVMLAAFPPTGQALLTGSERGCWTLNRWTIRQRRRSSSAPPSIIVIAEIEDIGGGPARAGPQFAWPHGDSILTLAVGDFWRHNPVRRQRRP